MDNSYDFLVKLLIIGDSGVGKTNLLLRACDNKFIPSHLMTIGIQFLFKASILKSKRFKMVIKKLKCKYGILPDKIGLKLSLKLIIKVLFSIYILKSNFQNFQFYVKFKNLYFILFF
jgi:GTPase SAR1 family protein